MQVRVDLQLRFAKLHHCCNLYVKYLFRAEALFNAALILLHTLFTNEKKSALFSFCELLIYSPTFVFFVGLTPPSFPFQFRTAQVGVSMSKECNTCVFSKMSFSGTITASLTCFSPWLMLHKPHS